MKIKISTIYAGVFVIAMVITGIASVFVPTVVNGYIIFSLMGLLGFGIFMTVSIFEKKLSFMDLSKIPQTEPEPEVDHRSNIGNYIVQELKKSVELKTITETLQKAGYAVPLITSVLQELIQKSIIKINEEKPKEVKKEKPKKKNIRSSKTIGL